MCSQRTSFKVLALLARGKRRANGKPAGQTVDVSIMERYGFAPCVSRRISDIILSHSMLNLMEGIIPEYSRKGVIRGPSGSSITGIVPTNAYPTSVPSAYVVIGANGESLYVRLMAAIGRTDLTGPDFAGNHKRVARRAELDDAIATWTRQHTPDEVCAAMDAAGVPVGRIMNVRDIMENEHVRARGMVERVRVLAAPRRGSDGDDEGWELDVPRVAPILECDARTRWAGPDLGQHNDEVLQGILGLSEAEISALKARGIISFEK